MKTFKKILLWLAAIPLALIAAVVVVQTYYALTPVPLSKQAEELNARAAKLPTVTENGYRLNGLLAPRGHDPVAYGKCLVNASEKRRDDEKAAGKEKPSGDDQVAWDAYWKDSSARLAELHAKCLEGGAKLSFPKALTDGKVNRPMSIEAWRGLAQSVPDAELIARADVILAAGPRRLGAEVDSPIPIWSGLMTFERWRIASGVLAWENGNEAGALAGWASDISHWSKSAHESLIGAMLAVAAQTQATLALQNAAARSGRLSDALAAAALSAVAPIETMPAAVSDSMLAEWQTYSRILNSAMVSPTFGAALGIDRKFMHRATDRLARFVFDQNDTINRFAETHLWSQEAIKMVASGQGAPEFSMEWAAFGCTTGGDWGMLCLPFMRNPIGRILAAIAAPMYTNYGTRVADLRNLASATRLTIEARRRGLSGDALAAFVANAPADMRDVFTGKPFEYDAAKKELRPVLREKNTVLGEKGPYALPL
jgi:hypothetical protein